MKTIKLIGTILVWVLLVFAFGMEVYTIDTLSTYTVFTEIECIGFIYMLIINIIAMLTIWYVWCMYINKPTTQKQKEINLNNDKDDDLIIVPILHRAESLQSIVHKDDIVYNNGDGIYRINSKVLHSPYCIEVLANYYNVNTSIMNNYLSTITRDISCYRFINNLNAKFIKK